MNCSVCCAREVDFTDFRGRVEVQCPRCRSLERHRFSAVALRRLVREPIGRVLHIAPEDCIASLLREAGDGYLSLDLDPKRGVDVVGDVTALPFPDCQFGLVYCSHVLEHVARDRDAMTEFYRVLKPGGLLLVMVPVGEGATDEDPEKAASPELRERNYGQSDHVRRYGLDIVERLNSIGFSTTPHASTDLLFRLEASEEVLNASEYLFLSWRPRDAS